MTLARTLRLFGLLWLVLIGSSLLGAPPASAHASLISTDPRNGAVVEAAPTQVTLTFNEPVGPSDQGFELTGPDGAVVTVAAVGQDQDVIATLPSGLGQGTHVLGWRVVSADGHPLAGTLTFSVGSAGPAPVVTASGDDPAVSLGYTVAQVLAYLGLLLLIGAMVFARWVSGASSRLVPIGAVLAVLGHAALVPLSYLRQQGLSLSGLWAAGWWSELWTGTGLALALVVVGSVLVLVTGRRTGWTRSLAVVGLMLLVGSAAATGHTRGAEAGPWLTLADLVHVATGGIWFGGLVALTAYVVRAFRGQDADIPPERVAELVGRFSSWAGWSVVALGISGVLMAVILLPNWDAVLSSDYGRTLLVKVALVLVGVVLAGWNRYRLLPALRAAGPDRARTRLRGLLLAESAVLVLVIAAAGLLVGHSPTAAEPTAAAPPMTAGATGFQVAFGAGSVEGSVTPGRRGLNTVTFTVLDPAGLPVSQDLRVDLLDSDGIPASIGLSPAPTLGTFNGVVYIPNKGEWTLRFHDESDVAEVPLTVR